MLFVQMFIPIVVKVRLFVWGLCTFTHCNLHVLAQRNCEYEVYSIRPLEEAIQHCNCTATTVHEPRAQLSVTEM